MSFVVLCDFDGTVVKIDTCTLVLEKFARTDWRVFEERFEKGELTLEECLQAQFSTVLASKSQMLEEVEKAASLRPGFVELTGYCKANGFPLILVSAGLDFIIKHFLKRQGLNCSLRICVPKAKFTERGIRFAFPRLRFASSVNFKDDLVSYYQKKGKKVVFIGDGKADYVAAKEADFSFAIRSSMLAELLREDGNAYKEIDNFDEVVEALSTVVPTRGSRNA
jgi:2-hydroxy-3-keto-5-methylthiopentenyl-1-phosphate phosphatase